MAMKRSQNIHDENEHLLSRQMPEIQASEGSGGVIPAGIAPPNMVPELEYQADSKLHNSFMQCPKCCNCNSGCSHYGHGHFDDNGNYIGPKK